jgi:LysR family transcriptional regulator, nitrogen assimilation regulatory protein
MRSLELFVAAYEERSFTLAALREGATQSGVSQHVRNLETRHGVQLFRREKGRVLPTPAADVFYQHCLAALRANDTAFQRLRQFSYGLSGETRLGLMPTMNASALAPALMRFRARHPNVKVSVTEAYSATLVAQVMAGELELAVVPAMPAVQGLKITPYMATPEMLVRSRGRATGDGPVKVRKLGPLKLVMPGQANVRAQTVRSYLNAQGAEIAEMIEMNSMMATLDLIGRSDWCAILPALLMATRTYGEIFDVRPLDPPMALQLVTVESAAHALSPAAEAFAEVLREACMELLQGELLAA